MRRDLGRLVEEKMIQQVLNGTGTAPQATGLLSRVDAPTSNSSAVATFSDYVSLGAQAVDGYHASDETDVDILFALDVYKYAAGLIATSTDTAAILTMKARCKRCKPTAFLADAPTTGGDANVNKNVILHAAGMNGGSQRYDSLGVIWSVDPT